MPTNKPRFTITMDQELFDRINNYQHMNRMSSQTKAVIELISKGLAAEMSSVSASGMDIDISPAALELARQFDRLDDHGQQVLTLIADLESKRMAATYAAETERFNNMATPSTESSVG